MLLYAWLAAAAAFVFVVLVRVAPQAALWNARMLPFLYLFSLLVAAYGASVVAAWLAELLQRRTGLSQRAWLAVVAVMVVAPVLGAWRHRGFVDDWARYNYSGFEVKEGWPEARALFNTLAALPPGRVMWEFNRDYERFGTTRTLENIPVFGGQPTMEGLLIESSMNAPFHFINQKETSKTATEAVPGVPYERFSSTSRPAWPTCGCTASATTSPTTPARTTRTSGWPAATSACRTRRCRRRPRPGCRWCSAAAASPSTRSAAATWSRCPATSPCWSTTPTGGPPGSPGTPNRSG